MIIGMLRDRTSQQDEYGLTIATLIATAVALLLIVVPVLPLLF